MNTLSKIAKRIFSADIKAQIEAGYLDNELKITDAGKLALTHILYEKETKALTDAANDLIARRKEEAKK